VALKDRLAQARLSRFVGRDAERALFAEALCAEEPPFLLLYLYGPGGVGKSALLRAFADEAARAGVPATLLDARDLPPGEGALAEALPRAAPGGRAVLLLDTLEAAEPELEERLRNALLPDLPDETFVAVASRHPPSAAWRADLGWQALLRTVPVRNFTPAESRALLATRGVPESTHADLLRLTHGHPLALALAVEWFERTGHPARDLADAPDVVAALLVRLVEKAPDEAHRQALEAATVARTLTEEALGDLLDGDPAEPFAWLRARPFVETTAQGLRLHELVYDALAADLRWRRPHRYAELERRARAHYTTQLLASPSGAEQLRLLADYAHLHRHNPIVRPFLSELQAHWRQTQPAVAGPPDPSEWAALREMVARHEGEAAAALADFWFGRPCVHIHVFRNEGGGPQGFLLCVDLEAVTQADRAADPAVEKASAYLDAHAPLRPGERATLFRFWMDADAYQRVSAVQSLIFVATVRHYLTTDALAFTFLPCAEPEFWAMVLTFAGLERLPEADFTVDGHTYGVFGHDWRAVPQAQWLGRIAALGESAGHSEAPASAEPLVVLSEPDFAEAVHDALRAFARPHDLAGNPLLRSRLVVARAGGDDRVTALRAAIEEAAEQLRATPREEPFYLALDATYLDPARTQAEAAEQLDLPFSTYRRYLKRAIDHVTAALWQEELAA